MKKFIKLAILLTFMLAMYSMVTADTYTIGTGTSNTSYSPFYGLYDYGWNKIIYTAAEMNTAGLSGAQNIYGLGFYAYNTPANYVMLDQKVFVRHTALSIYGTATDETGTGYPAAAGFSQVFDADVVYNGIGWYYIMFNTPFAWDGTSNLEIFWENWDGDYYSGYPTHTYTSTSTNYRTVYKYADTTFPTTVGTRTYNRPNVRFVTQTLDAAPTAVLASPVDGNWAFSDAVLIWNNAQGMASSYDLYLGTTSNPPFVANIQDMAYTPTLAAGTTYYWKVVARNANGAGTASAIWSFKTPGTEQLAESFDAATFPPLGWTNPGAFTRSTTTPIFYGAASLYKSATATPSMIYTPMLAIDASSTLDFYARTSVTTGIGRLQVKYSEDGTNWTAVGDEIAMPTNVLWFANNIDLSGITPGNYYLGFEVRSSTSTSVAMYIDYIFGPDFAALDPDPATVVYPADNGWAFLDASLSWAGATTGGIPTSYDVYFGTSASPAFVQNQTETTYTPTLAAGTTYFWQIIPRNGSGTASDCPVWSFTTPSATQLAESFDETAFPPVGWANPNSWSRSTTTPFYGAATAYKSAGTTPAILSTPILAINGASVLDFYYRTSSTTGYGLMNIKYSTDRVNWSQIGATISMPITTTWNNAVVNLGAIPAGNYYLGFEVSTSTSTSSIYIDHVFGPAYAAIAPEPVTQTAPAVAATDVSNRPTFTWTAPTLGGVPTGYKVYCDTNADPTTEIGDVALLTFTPATALNYSTLYNWKVVAYNGNGSSTGNTIRSFTTMADPTITVPWLEDFGTTGTTFPPTNWTRWSGALADPSTLASGSTIWGQDNWLNDTTVTPVNWSARMNIYSTAKQHWLITPPIQMPGAGYQLEFDIALTDFASTAPITDDPNGTLGVDDKFIVLIGDGVTWTPANILRQYDNAGSPYVYNSISHTGDHLVIPMDSYTGIKYIAFYGESTITNADNDFFVDNVMVRLTPAGAPEHVTLVSPANDATGIIPEHTTLNWTASLTGGTPAYYEIYVGANRIDPAGDYYGEYFYESTENSLDLSAQEDIDLSYGSTWYWAVLPFNAEGEAPDPADVEFMVWDFTIIEDPAIVSLPYEEYFDGVPTASMPYGWTGYVDATSTSAYVRTVTSYPVSTPNSVYLTNSTDAAADLRLITPIIDSSIPLNTIKLKFYARSSTAGYTLLVGTVDAKDSTGTFTQLESIVLTAVQTEYIISLDDYAGTDQYICFKHGLGGTSRSLYIDNVRLIELLPADLAATAISNPGIMTAGMPYDFTVGVFNEGTATQNAYTVKLMSAPAGTELATLNVSTPLAAGATAQHTLSWTPATGGTYNVYGKVVLTGDQSASNDDTPTTDVYVVDNTMTIVPVGDDASTTSGYYLPLGFYHKNSVSEELYFTDETHLQSGTISAVVYKNSFVTNLTDRPVKIWMAQTTVTDLTGGWLPAANYTLVFDGTVDFPSGINYIVIPLDTPYAFTGGTLATRVNRPMDTAYYTTSDKFFYTTTAGHTNRSRYLVNDTVVYDPLAPSAAGTAVGYVPNTMFVVEDAVMQTGAILEGYVRDASNNPIVGATVTLTERVAATTDATGYYKFTFWADTTVNATASMATYYSHTVDSLALTLGSTVTQNFSLVAMPRVTVSGIVTANDFPAGLVGAEVKLNGTESHTVLSVAGGAFSIPNVLGNIAGNAYTVTISKDGYVSYSGTTTVIESAVNLGTINLIERLWTPYNLLATHSGNNAELVWDPAGEPDYLLFDFENNDGEWLESGYGDWEWTNTYNPANYNTTGGSSGQIPPTAAHSGTGMWGTVMYAPYSNSGAYNYISKTVDLSGYTNSQLRYWIWNDLFGYFDYLTVRINGATVDSLIVRTSYWQERIVDLSAFEGNPNVTITFAAYATTGTNYAGAYLDDIYIGPAPTRATAQFGSKNGDRSFQNYDLYRLVVGDEATPANWTMLQSAYADTSYTDTGFAAVPGNKYKWAVKANYSGSLASPAILSNSLGRVYMPQDITATTVGATVVLSWTAEPGASAYKVYSSDDPYGTFTYLGNSITNSYTISSPVAKKFYKVSAVADEELRESAPAK